MKVTLVLATVATALAANVSFGFRRFTIAGTDPIDTQDTQVSFDLPAGDYTATEQDFAADGSPLGLPQTASFTVPADVPVPPPAPAMYQAAAGLQVILG